MRRSMLPDLTLFGWIVLLLVVTATLLGILRAIGTEYEHAVRWHTLRTECHRLRRERVLAHIEMMDEDDPERLDLVAAAMKRMPPDEAAAQEAGDVTEPAVAGSIGAVEDAAPASLAA